MQTLDKSVIAFAYKEVAPPVRAFGNLVAQCFETQAVIALVNCTLTTLGLYWLKVRTARDYIYSFVHDLDWHYMICHVITSHNIKFYHMKYHDMTV